MSIKKIIQAMGDTGGGSTPTPAGDSVMFKEGQSNNMGVAKVADLLLSPLNAETYILNFTKVKIWVPGGTLGTGAYQALSIAINNRAFNSVNGLADDSFGPEFGVALRWEAERSGTLYIHKTFIDGAPIDSFLKSTHPGTYNNLKADRLAAIAALSGANIQSSVWVLTQGESDFGHTEVYYEGAVTGYINDQIADGMIFNDTKIIITDIESHSINYDVNISNAKEAVVVAFGGEKVPYTNNYGSVPQSTVANLHLNAKGQLQLGFDIFEKAYSAPHRAAA